MLFQFQPNTVDEDFNDLETDRFKDEYDRNNDGFLTGDELLFWVSFFYFESIYIIFCNFT